LRGVARISTKMVSFDLMINRMQLIAGQIDNKSKGLLKKKGVKTGCLKFRFRGCGKQSKPSRCLEVRLLKQTYSRTIRYLEGLGVCAAELPQ
jgi:hypothetical protein